MNKRTVAALIGALVCVGSCKKDEAGTQQELCAPGELTNRVTAAPWATKRAGVHEYVYQGDVFGGPADVYLYGEGDELLGTMRVGQLFGGDEPDGTMEAVFDPDGYAPLRLLTKGSSTHDTGYTLQMRLQPADGPAVQITAEFDATTCWAPASEVAPPCANGVPLDDAAFTLPSCGLAVDQLVREKRPPLLTRLAYAVAKEDAAGAPSVGGMARVDGVERYVIDVFNRQPTDRDIVAQWLDEAGLNDVIGSEQERLLTTAYLDRAWWQMLESHVAYCDLDRLRAPTADARQFLSCPGEADKNDHAGKRRATARSWGEPHLVTFDGLAYDLQAAGEFIAVESTTDDPFQIQLRYEPFSRRTFDACGHVTTTTAIATMVGERRVTVIDNTLRVDGEVVTDVNTVEVPDGAELEWTGSRITITWPGGEHLTYRGTTAEFSLPDERAGKVRGILGQFDGVPTNDLQLRDGSQLDMPATFELLHGRYADSWRVGDESLFDYEDGAQTGSFDVDGFPSQPARAADLPEEERAAAKIVCEERGLLDPYLLDACILDVVCLTGDDAERDDAEEVAQQTPAPPIFAVQPLGAGVMVIGDIRPVIEPIQTFNPPLIAACTAATTPTIALFEEQIVTLSGAIEVDLAEPGRYEHGDASATTIDDGTTVRVVHLAQQQLRELAVSGTVRFDVPILGVIVEPDTLTATDGALGAPSITYPSEEVHGLQDGDAIMLSDDRRTLNVRWGGEVHHRLRVVLRHELGGE